MRKEILEEMEIKKTESHVDIILDLPWNDYYNGDWKDVSLYSMPETDDMVGIQFHPELGDDSTHMILWFEKKYVIVKKKEPQVKYCPFCGNGMSTSKGQNIPLCNHCETDDYEVRYTCTHCKNCFYTDGS